MIWNYHIAYVPAYFANMNVVQWSGRLTRRGRKDNNREQKIRKDYKKTTRPRKRHRKDRKKQHRKTTPKKHEKTQQQKTHKKRQQKTQRQK